MKKVNVPEMFMLSSWKLQRTDKYDNHFIGYDMKKKLDKPWTKCANFV